MTPWAVAVRLLCPWDFFQAGILEWVAISYSRGSSWPGSKPKSAAWQEDSLWLNHPGSPCIYHVNPLTNQSICFIKESKVTENQADIKLVMPIIYISDTCFQISTLSLIKSVQSIEKVWEERKRSRRGNCKWENYWPHSRSSGHHRQNPGTAPPGPEAFWHIEVTVGRR